MCKKTSVLTHARRLAKCCTDVLVSDLINERVQGDWWSNTLVYGVFRHPALAVGIRPPESPCSRNDRLCIFVMYCFFVCFMKVIPYFSQRSQEEQLTMIHLSVVEIVYGYNCEEGYMGIALQGGVINFQLMRVGMRRKFITSRN